MLTTDMQSVAKIADVSLYDCGAHHNQSYTSGVNRTETNAAVTRHRTLPVYGLIIHQRLH